MSKYIDHDGGDSDYSYHNGPISGRTSQALYESIEKIDRHWPAKPYAREKWLKRYRMN